MSRFFIAGTGFHLPDRVITNDEIAARAEGCNTDWVVRAVGIEERRGAPADENTSDLGVHATRAALERAGWSGGDLDLLVCATSTPDTLIPATASWICKKMEIDPVAFDVNAACSGFVYGLATADAVARAQGYERVALTTAEKYTRVTDYDDRSTAIFFGDSAATVLLQRDEPEQGFEVVDLIMENVNKGAELVTTPVGGFFWQDGRRVKDQALASFEKSARDILGRNDLSTSDLRAFAGHQANMRVLETVAGTVDVTSDQHWHNVSKCGNQGAAGVITTFCSHVESEELAHGDLILLTVFGSGFTTGSALLRRIDKS